MIQTLKSPAISVPDSIRFWSLSTYATPEHIEKALNAVCDKLDFASYILHDKDKTDEGHLKEVHAHINLVLSSPRKIDFVRGIFKTSLDLKGEIANTLAKPTLFTPAADLYMTHHTQTEGVDIVGHHKEHTPIGGKFQYVEEIIKVIKGDRREYVNLLTETAVKLDWMKSQKEQKSQDKAQKKQEQSDECNELIEDIIAEKPSREMACKYGRDYMRNHKQYKEYCAQIVLEETGDLDKAFRLVGSFAESQYYEKVKSAYNSGAKITATNMRQVLNHMIQVDKSTRAGVVSQACEALLKELKQIERNIINE